MKITRAPRSTNYTILPNTVARDKALSFRSRGILVYLLSLADGWETNSKALVEQASEGRDAIRASLKELEAAGYLIRTRYRDQRGIWRCEWTVHETPQPVDNSGEEANQVRVSVPGQPYPVNRTRKPRPYKEVPSEVPSEGEEYVLNPPAAPEPVDNFPPPKIENEDAAPPPLDVTDPRKCVTHQGVEDPPPCYGCKTARERWEAHAAIKDRELARARREHEKAMRRATEEDAARRRADPEEQAKKEAARAMARAVAKGGRQ